MFVNKTKSYTFDLRNRIKHVFVFLCLKISLLMTDLYAIKQKCCTYNKYQNRCRVLFGLRACT